jgi:hypothetical protein
VLRFLQITALSVFAVPARGGKKPLDDFQTSGIQPPRLERNSRYSYPFHRVDDLKVNVSGSVHRTFF